MNAKRFNLVLLRDQAIYQDGSTASGAGAYTTYSRLSAPVRARVGGRLVWRGMMEQMPIRMKPLPSGEGFGKAGKQGGG